MSPPAVGHALEAPALAPLSRGQRPAALNPGHRPAAAAGGLFGPGVLAMLGQDEGPSMLSYARSGASYGVGFFLPFILVTFAAAYVVQEMAGGSS